MTPDELRAMTRLLAERERREAENTPRCRELLAEAERLRGEVAALRAAAAQKRKGAAK